MYRIEAQYEDDAPATLFYVDDLSDVKEMAKKFVEEFSSDDDEQCSVDLIAWEIEANSLNPEAIAADFTVSMPKFSFKFGETY